MTKKHPDFEVLNKAVCRLPGFPLVCISNLANNRLAKIANQKLFKDAIYISSPSFHKKMDLWLKGKITDKQETFRIEQTVYKYLLMIIYIYLK